MNEPQKVTYSQGIHDESSTQKETLGCLRVLADGRKFRYAHNGGVALVAGVPLTAPDCVANHLECAVVSGGARGTTSVEITLGATAATLNQYKDGYLQISGGGAAYGVGQQYLIDGNPVIGSAGTGFIQLRESIRVALLAGTTTVSLIHNPYDLVVAAGAGQDLPAGVPTIPVTISYYFWSQTGGLANALCTNTLGEGIAITSGAGLYATVSGSFEPVVGWSHGRDGKTSVTTPVILTID